LIAATDTIYKKICKGDEHVRFFTITGVSLLLVLTLIPAFASVPVKHGCAPVIPPTISGTLVQPTATRGTLFINEVLLVPHSTWNCSELGTFTPTDDTWLEIYNTQDQPFDLYAVHASIDSGPSTNPFYLPFGSAIAPHGFLVVFPRTDESFISTETSQWRLLIDGIAVDEVTIPSLGEDQSYARIPDGSPSWVITSIPTIDSSNITSVIPPTHTMTRAQSTATAHILRGTNGRSSSNRGTRNGNEGIGTDNNGGTPTDGQQINGVQPTWSTLQHPVTVLTSQTLTTASSNSLVQGKSNELDILHKFLLIILIVALAAALFWCWRLFRTS
jgi:hypothetical protein